MAEQERFSMREILKQDKGETEKSVSSIKATKTANNKAAKSNGKYNVKIVDGVKYMVLK